MSESKLYDEIAKKAVDIKEIADRVIKNPKLLPKFLKKHQSEYR